MESHEEKLQNVNKQINQRRTNKWKDIPFSWIGNSMCQDISSFNLGLYSMQSQPISSYCINILNSSVQRVEKD